MDMRGWTLVQWTIAGVMLPIICMQGCADGSDADGTLAPGALSASRPGAVLSIADADGKTVLVIDDPRRIGDVLAALPEAASSSLLARGYYETSDPEIARSHWRTLFVLFDGTSPGHQSTATKLDGPACEIDNTSWGKIKVIFS
jgi:hypothetical protein